MNYSMYIGGYGQESIARAALHDGRLRLTSTYPAVNASYLCLSPDEKHLYAVGETKRFRGEAGGSVQSYDIAGDGALTETSIQPTHGEDPCHLSIVGNLLLTANYASGSVSRFSLEPDGRIGAALPLIQHHGHGAKPDRQSGPHTHQVQRTPGGWLAVSDLGLDAVFFYPAAELSDEQPQPLKVSTPAGFGPRHCAFPRGRDTWYVLCELVSELLIYRGTPGSATLIGRVPVGDGAGENYPAALRLSPDERLLAATGRGQNVISLCSIGENGMLARLTEVSSGGDWPRDVQFTPDGRFLVCCSERSNRVTAFALSEGRLEQIDALELTAPTNVIFRRTEE